MAMDNFYDRFQILKPEDTFRFECRCCGECCRNVEQQVMVESLDLFRIARHLDIDTAEAANRYTTATLISWGAPILLLKTKLAGDVCVFLKSGKCGIQAIKPRACRLYPLTLGLGPGEENLKDFIIYKSPEKPFHYNGPEQCADEWVKANFDDEARAYISSEYEYIRSFGKMMRQIPKKHEATVERLMLLYRYFYFDTDQAFMPQFLRNMVCLTQKLQDLIPCGENADADD